MLQRLTLTAIGFLVSIFAFSQSGIKGKVQDTTAHTVVPNAVVALLSPQDTILEKFVRSGKDGTFNIEGLIPGEHLVMVMHPLFADYIDKVILKPDETLMNFIVPLTPKSKMLEAVIIKSGSSIRIKGDTTVYTADSFKVSANANVEELLRKLPGIQVDKNGEIKAMGQKVERVLVDGEEFFGDDPGMAVKNLRADAVKEVQVFDKKSDQAEFTGIDDGNTKKTINLKLKEDKKKGYFGKASVAGGLIKDIDDRYNNNFLISSFKGKRKISAFLLNGNTGQDGLSWSDNDKYGLDDDNISISVDDDGGVTYTWTSGTSADEEPFVNTENGFIKNINAGIQYSNKWNDKHNFNFSPRYNSQDYSNNQDVLTQTRLYDSVAQRNISLNSTSHTLSQVDRYNYKLKAVYDVKIDSANSLKITAGANFYHTESQENNNATTVDDLGVLKNKSDRLSYLNSDKSSFSATALFRHKFKKARRTFSFTANWNRLGSNGNNRLNSDNQAYNNGTPSFLQVIDQNRTFDKTSTNATGKLVYTEPLSAKYALELSYSLTLNRGLNNQVTYTQNPGSGKYDLLVDSLTNDFDQHITIHSPGAKLNYSTKKLKFNFGGALGLTHFNLQDNSFNRNYIRNYTNIFPTASLNYSYKSNRNLRFQYNGNTTQPTINQLQPLRDNNNYFNQYIGNPNLKPSFTNSFNLSHKSYNFLKEMWTYASLNFNQVSNAITYNRIILIDSAKTITQPINTDGNYNISFWSGIGLKMRKIDTRINFQPNFTYYRSKDVINNVGTAVDNFSGGLSVYLSKSKDKKYDFSLGNSFNYNSSKTSQVTKKVNYRTNTLSANATIYIKKVWSINTDYAFNARSKTQESQTNLNNHIWNARLQKTFHQDEFTAFFMIRDILNQNFGIDRSFYSNTYTETRNDRLKRYWMLGFSWDFRNKGPKANPTPQP